MSFREVTQDGSVLIVPASSVSITVATQPSGISTTGIMALVGEADEGPAWNDPGEKLSNNSFGPGDLDKVTSKYGEGNLVDAFNNNVAPSLSPKVSGGPNRFILVKTNSSAKATGTTADNHGTFSAKRGGQPGNLIKYNISDAISEQAPTTGSLSYVPSASSSAAAIRVNGGSRQSLAISADETPTALAAAISGLSNLNAVGGVNRSALSGLSGQNISLTVVSGQNVNIAIAVGQVFANAPQVGDTVRIPSGSVIEGGSAENVGWYLVTSVSNSTSLAQISATKITTGAPANVAPIAISVTPDNDMIDYSSMRIDNMSGTDRNILSGLTGQNITISASGANLTATLAAGQVWASSPKIGDIVYIPSSSPYKGAGNANVGWYQVTATSNTLVSATITASRLSNGNPVAVSAAAIVAASDLQDLKTQIGGVGKSLEISDNAGTVSITTVFKQLGVDSPASWISSGATPLIEVSGAELEKSIKLTRSSTNSSETFNVGGDVVMSIGYQPSSPSGTASMSIVTILGVRHLQTTVSGGPGVNLDIDLSKVPTINDLVSIIASNAGYLASASTAAEGQRSPSVLDQVSSMGICSELGSKPGRVKSDLYDMTTGSGGLSQSQLITYATIAVRGLPDSQNDTFLSGGSKGSTTGLQFSQAIDALKAVVCNFVVPLVSQDAADDITDGATEGGSTYQIDAVNSLVRSHVLSMSTPKLKRNRIGIVSKRDTFDNVKTSAQNMSTFRIAHTFQDMKDANSNGGITQYQPWMAAAKAAAFQAAAFSKTIFNKAVNCSGVLQAAGDWDDGNLSDLENALQAGLLPLNQQANGNIIFSSDQTTYSVDNNFVYNSIQAVYTADIIALSLAESLQNAFVGEVTADVTPAAVIAFIKAKMLEFLNLKLTAATPQAPSGWVDIKVDINVPTMNVKVIAVESTGIYFIPINLVIEGVQTSASA